MLKRFFPGTDFFNPILVREVRQMVRSRWILVAMMLQLLAMVGLTFIPIAEYLAGGTTEESGQYLCGATFAVMFAATLGTVIIHTLWRLAFDRIHAELSFYSTLTPDQHVRGRLACGVIISLLFFSMAGPNLAASYLFRGVDIWIYFVVPPFLFLAIQIVNLLVLAVFAPVRTPLQLLFYACLAFGVACALFGIFILFMEVIGEDLLRSFRYVHTASLPTFLLVFMLPFCVLLGMPLVMIAGGHHARRRAKKRAAAVRQYDLVFGAILYLVAYLLLLLTLLLALLQLFGIQAWEFAFGAAGIFGFFADNASGVFLSYSALILVLVIIPVTAFLFACCSLSPYSMNRMRPIRIWMTVLLALSFLMMLSLLLLNAGPSFMTSRYRPFDPFAAWVPTVVGILSAMLILAVCERETWEGRVRREIPKSVWGRALVFPFSTGSINGLAWVFLATVLLIAVVSVFMVTMQNSNYHDIIWPFVFLMLQMYVFNCSMAAFGLWKIFLSRWIPRDMIWAITVGLFIGLYMATVILLEPILRIDDMLIGYILVVANIVWFLLTFVVAYPWLRGRFLDFTPMVEDGKSHLK